MKNRNVRGYIISAMRFYARMGEPDVTEIKKLKHISEAERLDLSAVASMLEILSERRDVSALAAVREIYFFEPQKKLNKQDISKRVIHYALDNYISERTVWSSINRAWDIFISVRVLRVDK